MRATDKRIELLPPQLNAREIRLDGVFTRDRPGWDADLIRLPEEVLVSESKSRIYEGLRLREPNQFLFDATPRAQRFLQRFPAPHECAKGIARF